MTERLFVDMPDRIARLDRDARGFPVPEFAMEIDGVPDFRVVKPGYVRKCIIKNNCWICGERLGVRKAFVIGPMCCINRISAEPPSHRDCALFAAKNCPFLSMPLARRNDRDLPVERSAPGKMILRNPGVCAVWMTKRYDVMRVDNGILLQIGEPEMIEFYAKGRIATRAEVDHSIRTGLPILEAEAKEEGLDAERELTRALLRFDPLLEKAVMS
jgi:hypothetical protein